MQTMEEDEPLSSAVPALDTEEGLSTPVAGPETPFRPTSCMPPGPHADRGHCVMSGHCGDFYV